MKYHIDLHAIVDDTITVRKGHELARFFISDGFMQDKFSLSNYNKRTFFSLNY